MSKMFDEIQAGFGIVQGWRSISAYLGRSSSTVRRWHYEARLPILRTITRRPFAFKFELDAFMMEVSQLIKENRGEQREALRKHAAMMRSCKGKKDGKK